MGVGAGPVGQRDAARPRRRDRGVFVSRAEGGNDLEILEPRQHFRIDADGAVGQHGADAGRDVVQRGVIGCDARVIMHGELVFQTLGVAVRHQHCDQEIGFHRCLVHDRAILSLSRRKPDSKFGAME